MTDREQTPRARRWLSGRQVQEPGNPRPIRHVVKVTREQEERLLIRAASRRITVSRLMLESALSGDASAAETKAELAGELFRVSRLLGRVGVNLNQVARATNIELEMQPEFEPVMQEVGRAAARLNRLLDDVERESTP